MKDGVSLTHLKHETQYELIRPDIEALIAYAQVHRPDIRQSAFKVEQADMQLGIARSRFYPEIYFSVAYEGTHMDALNLEKEEYDTSVGLSLSYNIFSGGSDRARIRVAREKALELQKYLENQKISVNAEVRKSHAQLLSAQEQLCLHRSNTELIQKNRDLVDQEYSAGQVSLVRLNEAQRDLIKARSRLALALVTLRQIWITLETHTGRIIEILADDYDRRRICQ